MKCDPKKPVTAEILVPAHREEPEEYINVILAHAPCCVLVVKHHGRANVDMLTSDLSDFLDEKDETQMSLTCMWEKKARKTIMSCR